MKERWQNTYSSRVLRRITVRRWQCAKYTSNLEAVVEDRTRQLMEEKAKIDHLLYNMMPAYVTCTHAVGRSSLSHNSLQVRWRLSRSDSKRFRKSRYFVFYTQQKIERVVCWVNALDVELFSPATVGCTIQQLLKKIISEPFWTYQHFRQFIRKCGEWSMRQWPHILDLLWKI